MENHEPSPRRGHPDAPESHGRRRSLGRLLLTVAAVLAADRIDRPRRTHHATRTAERRLRQLALAGDRLLDLNHAGTRELCRLPGIGPTLARRIVAFRERVRPFAEPGDLSLIPGISQNLLSRLSPYLCAGAP